MKTYINKFNEEANVDLNILRDSYYAIGDAIQNTDKIINELNLLGNTEANKLGINTKKEIELFNELQRLFRKSNIGRKL